MTWQEIGKRIKNLRSDRKLTQEQFGKLIGKSSQYVGRMERGRKLSVELIAAICKKTGVTTDYIIHGAAIPATDMELLKDLSPEQIEISLDILKRLVDLINTENGNELLMKELMRRQSLPV